MIVLGYVISGLFIFCAVFVGFTNVVSGITNGDSMDLIGGSFMIVAYGGLSAYILYLIRRVQKAEKQLSKNS